VGRSGIGKNRKRPDSFGCIDVLEGNKPRFMVNPFVAKCHKDTKHLQVNCCSKKLVH